MIVKHKPLTNADGELRKDLTDRELAGFRPAHEVLPADFQHMLGVRKRGPQKAPKKIATSIRLSPMVIEAFKATGNGWQARIDEALRTFLKEHPTF
jgi:uncharacterized protein (DUF4415 family)